MARRTKAEADETRTKLLDAAEQVFFEKGVARASLNEIAQRAGATRGAVYWHFKDKVDVFTSMLSRICMPFEELCDDKYQELVPLERIRKSISKHQFEHPMGNFSITMSFGIASTEAGILSGDIETLLLSADAALYKAKHNGRNCTSIA